MHPDRMNMYLALLQAIIVALYAAVLQTHGAGILGR
jgi:hypothetical protein